MEKVAEVKGFLSGFSLWYTLFQAEFYEKYPETMKFEQPKPADVLGKKTAEDLIGKVRELLDDGLVDQEAHQSALSMLHTAELLCHDKEIQKILSTLRQDIYTRYGDVDPEQKA